MIVFALIYFDDIFFSNSIDIAFLLVVFLGFIFTLQILITTLSFVFIHYAITDKRAIFQSGIIGRDFRSLIMIEWRMFQLIWFFRGNFLNW